MNVKPEIFQATKQTILKNKQEFIEIQLKEGAKRINALKNQNLQLKAEIKQLKSKNHHTIPNKISITTREMGENKENKCINLARKRNRDVEAVTERQEERYEEEKEQEQWLNDELRELEIKFAEQEKEREKQVLYLEDYIKMLKKIWMENQSAVQTRSHENDIAPTVRTRDLKQVRKTEQIKITRPESKKNFFDSKPSNMVVSRESLNQSSIQGYETNKIPYNNSLNTSNYMETSQSTFNSGVEKSIHNVHNGKFGAQPRRKTMSLNLNTSTGHLMGFNFGKKSINKVKPTQKTQVSHFNTSQINQKEISYPNEAMNTSNCSHSILSHSNSRNSMSIYSNTGSNKSQLKRSQASKSYAKIVTKLKCKGCGVEFRPNEYYRHVEQCRDFLKVTLLEQKMKVQDQINQTLNFSMTQNHYR